MPITQFRNRSINNNQKIQNKFNQMGCAVTQDQKTINQLSRQYKKSQKIDTRRKSMCTFDIVLENVLVEGNITDEKDSKFAQKYLKEHSLFYKLQASELNEIVKHMEVATAKKGDYIFREGDVGVCFFLIRDGEVGVEVEGKHVRNLYEGQCFGEVALIYSSKRTASVKCQSQKLKLLMLRAQPFKAAIKRIRQQNNQTTRKIIENVPIFSLLTTKQKYAILNCLVKQHYKKGTILFRKNDVPVSFYIVEKGKVHLTFDDPKKKDTILGELQSFGQSAFKAHGLREGTATVEEDLDCLTINQQKMKQCLGNTLSHITFHNIKKWALKSSKLFSHLTSRQIDKIAQQFSTKTAQAHQIIMDMDKPVDALIICLEGKINNKSVGTLFNQNFYINAGHLDNDLVKNQRGIYARLQFDRLRKVITDINNKTDAVIALKSAKLISRDKQNIIDFGSLDYITKIGQGQFGSVHLVRDTHDGILYAVKSLQKSKIVSQGMQEIVLSQRQILQKICHPLIVGYYKAYQDQQHVYFLMQYIQGVQMFEAIRQIGLLNKTTARFYLGSIISAIEYIHSRNIIYRDIKPQNAIVNYEGRVMLIDMGTAKQLTSQNGYRTDTIIGTPHYMAPEVMQGKGYSFQADYWSLGVLLYELVCGKLPFAENLDNPYLIYSEIIKSRLVFPSFLTDQTAKDLMKRLLSLQPQQRAGGNVKNIKQAQYFTGFDWQELEHGKMAAPYIPRKFRFGNQSVHPETNGKPFAEYLHRKKDNLRIKTWSSKKIQ